MEAFDLLDRIEGKRAVIEALRSGVPISKVLLADNAQRDSLIKDILRKADQRGIDVELVPRKKLDDMSASASRDRRGDKGAGAVKGGGKTAKAQVSNDDRKDAHQGIIALAEPFRYASVSDILSRSDADFKEHQCSLVVVCDHITDAGNLGAIIRSAESVGAAGLIIPNKRAAQVSPVTYKTSAGAVSHLPIAQVANIANTLELLKERGFWVAGATEHADGCIWDTNLEGRIAIVMGNEGDGISRLVLEHCDLAMSIPQMGEISSLNVAQSSTVCMYEWLRQNRAGFGSEV